MEVTRIRFQYGYDRDSNRLYEKNVVDATFSELYHADGASAGYDSLNQLTEFQRGTLSDANSDGVPDTVSTATRSQSWDFDALGNFDNQTTDGTGQSRSHNKQNQITSIQNLTTPTYDANGNMIGDENGKTLVFDAWNRLVAYKNGSTTLVSNAHDALGRRVIENPGTQTDLFYSAEWQVLEEREGTLVRSQNVWSPVYIDAMVLRDRDTDVNGSLEQRVYVQHDANYNVSAIVSTSGVVLERYAPDAYGAPKFLNADFSTRSSSGYDWIYIHQGGRFQIVTGLYHFRNRELSATLGRWISNDPALFAAQDNNLYGYVGSASLNHRDPYGLWADPLDENDPFCPFGPPITPWNPGTWDAFKYLMEYSIDYSYMKKGCVGLCQWRLDLPHERFPTRAEDVKCFMDLSWFSRKWSLPRFGLVGLGCELRIQGDSIVHGMAGGAMGSSSLFGAVAGNVGTGMFSRRHRSRAAS